MKPIKLWLLILTVLLFSTESPPVYATKKKHECAKVQKKISKIQKKMRSGYTAKQGEKYHKQLNELYKKEFKFCF